MIIGLDNSGKTSVLNSLHSLTTTSSHQDQSSLSSSNSFPSAPTSKLTDIQQQLQQQQNLLPVANGNELSLSRGQDMSLGEEDLLAGGSDEFCEQELASSRIVLADPMSKLSGFSYGQVSSDNYLPTIGYNFERLHYKGQTLNVLDFSGQSKYRGLWQEFYNCVDAIVFVIDSSDMIRLVVVRDELENTLNHPYFKTLQQPEQQASDSTTKEINNNNNNIGNTSTVPFSGSNRTRQSSQVFDLVQKQLTISHGMLIQSPLDRGGSKHATSQQSPETTKQTKQQQHQQRQRPSTGTPGTGSSRKSAMGHGQRTRVPILFLANKTDLINSVDTEAVIKNLNLSDLDKSQQHPWHVQSTSVKTNQGIAEGFDWILGQLL